CFHHFILPITKIVQRSNLLFSLAIPIKRTVLPFPTLHLKIHLDHLDRQLTVPQLPAPAPLHLSLSQQSIAGGTTRTTSCVLYLRLSKCEALHNLLPDKSPDRRALPETLSNLA